MKNSWTYLVLFGVLACSGPKAENNSFEVEKDVNDASEVEAIVEVDSGRNESPQVEIVPLAQELTLKISKVEELSEGFIYDSGLSPDGKVEIRVDEMEPNTYVVIINTDSSSFDVPDLYVSPTISVWSEDSRYIALNSEDLYAGSGSTEIAILDVTSGAYKSVSCEDIAKGIDTQKREKYILTDLRFTTTNELQFRLGANYLGDSGHPGIDEARMAELGSNYGADDEMFVGYFSIRIDD